MSERPKLVFPHGVTPTHAHRLADITEALEPLGVEALIDLNLYDLDPPHCEGCGCLLEAGHCYCCFPVLGYGDPFQEARHGEGFRPSFPRDHA